MADAGELLVIGATAGIGAAIWRLAASRGQTVIGVGRNRAAGEALASEAGGRFIAADIAREEQVEALFDGLAGVRLAGAINNAAMTHDSLPIDRIPIALFDEVFALNVRGLFLCLAREMGMLRGVGGAIVNVASIAGKRGFAGLAAYSASKHAVIGLTRAAALDGAADGVRVNALLPGTTRSEMFERQMLTRPGGTEGTRARIPIGRIAEPAEQAEAALWLLSDAASFVTGECLTADGGTTAGC